VKNSRSKLSKTNIIGTQNVIDAAIENGVKKVINISTDKAADPVNFYGMTEAIGEKLIVYANVQNVTTRFVNVRGGNILGSSGSVLNLFIDQLREKRQISITDKDMVRYFMTARTATKLLLTAAKEGKGGELFVMMMISGMPNTGYGRGADRGSWNEGCRYYRNRKQTWRKASRNSSFAIQVPSCRSVKQPVPSRAPDDRHACVKEALRFCSRFAAGCLVLRRTAHDQGGN
jgi:hypothetical protein